MACLFCCSEGRNGQTYLLEDLYSYVSTVVGLESDAAATPFPTVPQSN